MGNRELSLVLLAVLFLVLKATGLTHWSWLVVLSPVWVPVLFTVVLGSTIMSTIIVFEVSKKLLRRN